MDVRKKVAFVLPYIGGGGAERVVLTILRHIDRDKFKPTLVLFEKKGEYLDLVPSDVDIVDLKSPRARNSILKLPKVIRELDADIVFSTLSHVNLLIAMIRPFFPRKIQFVARESNTASLQVKEEKFSFISNLLHKRLYKKFDLVIAQSDFMKNDLVKYHGCEPEKVVKIYNPVDIDKIDRLIATNEETEVSLPENKINLLCVGRLCSQKGYDYLIPALQKLDERFYLTILGEGDDLAALQKLAKETGVDNRINFAGFVHNPYKIMSDSDFLILSSRYEGLPNVVLEANSCGKPVVAFNSPGGTSEIVIDKLNGILVEKIDSMLLADKILEATAVDFEAQAIKKHIVDNFHADKIVREYEKHLLAI